MHVLSYDCASDAVDEYQLLRLSTADKGFKQFIKIVVDNFSEEYLRTPTEADLKRLLHHSQKCGSPVMLGCLDC